MPRRTIRSRWLLLLLLLLMMEHLWLGRLHHAIWWMISKRRWRIVGIQARTAVVVAIVVGSFLSRTIGIR